MSLLDTYRSSHQHPKNQFFHLFGIPTIVAAIVVMFWNIRVGMGLFLFGWVLQFAGHLFEKKLPSFVANPIYLLVGPYWWTKEIGALIKKAWVRLSTTKNMDFLPIEGIEEVVRSVDGALCCHNVKVLPEKGGFILSLDLQLSGNITLERANEITKLVKHRLEEEFPGFSRVVVDAKPDGCPTCKKKSLEQNATRGTHEISVDENISHFQKGNRFPNPRVTFVEPMPPA